MLEAYEVFDASTEQLVAELPLIRQQLRGSQGAAQLQLRQLLDLVQEELQERGCSQSLYEQLASMGPPAEASPPEPPAQPPTSLRQELEHLISQGNQVVQQALARPLMPSAPPPAPPVQVQVQAQATPAAPYLPPTLAAPTPAPAPAPQAATLTSPAPTPPSPHRGHGNEPSVPYSPLPQPQGPTAAPTAAAIPTATVSAAFAPSAPSPAAHPQPQQPPQPQPQQQVGQAAMGGAVGREEQGSDDDDNDDNDDEEEGKGEEGEGEGEGEGKEEGPHRPKLSPWEAAVLAFKREQQQLSRARKAIKKPVNTKTKVSPAAYLQPPSQQQQQQGHHAAPAPVPAAATASPAKGAAPAGRERLPAAPSPQLQQQPSSKKLGYGSTGGAAEPLRPLSAKDSASLPATAQAVAAGAAAAAAPGKAVPAAGQIMPAAVFAAVEGTSAAAASRPATATLRRDAEAESVKAVHMVDQVQPQAATCATPAATPARPPSAAGASSSAAAGPSTAPRLVAAAAPAASTAGPVYDSDSDPESVGDDGDVGHAGRHASRPSSARKPGGTHQLIMGQAAPASAAPAAQLQQQQQQQQQQHRQHQQPQPLGQRPLTPGTNAAVQAIGASLAASLAAPTPQVRAAAVGGVAAQQAAAPGGAASLLAQLSLARAEADGDSAPSAATASRAAAAAAASSSGRAAPAASAAGGRNAAAAGNNKAAAASSSAAAPGGSGSRPAASGTAAAPKTVDTDSDYSSASDDGGGGDDTGGQRPAPGAGLVARHRQRHRRMDRTGSANAQGGQQGTYNVLEILGPSSKAYASHGAPMPVDRWADWEIADSGDGVSAWGTQRDDDPLQDPSRLRIVRASRHAPPQALSGGGAGAAGAGGGAARRPSQSEGAQSTPGQGQQGQGRDGSIQLGVLGSSSYASASGGAVAGELIHTGNRSNRPQSALQQPQSQLPTPSLARPMSQQQQRVGASAGRDGDGGDSTDADSPRPGTGAGPASQQQPQAQAQAQAPSLMPRSGMIMAGSSAAGMADTVVHPVEQQQQQQQAQLPPRPGTSSSGGPGATTPPRPLTPLDPSQQQQQQQQQQLRSRPVTPMAPGAGPPLSARSASPSAGAGASTLTPYVMSPAASTYLPHFGHFHEIMAVCHTAHLEALIAGGGGGGHSRPGSSASATRSAMLALQMQAQDVAEKYGTLLARCEGWLAEAEAAPHMHSGHAPGGNGSSSAGVGVGAGGASASRPATAAGAAGEGGSVAAAATAFASRRLYSVTDECGHPEVREVLRLATRLLGGWAEDPIDQVTDAASDGAASTSDATPPLSRPGTSSLGSRALALTQQQGQLGQQGTGRFHMWNLLWTWSVKVRIAWSDLLAWQRVNHFSEARQLTRKDLLSKHLQRYQVMHSTGRTAALFHLLPTTFTLPKDGPAFSEAYSRALNGVESSVVQPMGLNLWIQKPVGLSRGRGISIISSPRQVHIEEDAVIVQRYITNPLLVQGHKWDLRLYVLVTSFQPLEAWLHEEGFARFATAPFTLDESKLTNTQVHLTNSSVQKEYVEAGKLPEFLKKAELDGGSKTSLTFLRQLLEALPYQVDWDKLWGRLCEAITAALFAAQDAIPHCSNSFELFGFDLLVDEQLRVWLIEVNSSPSLALDTELDRDVKPRVVADVLRVLDPLPFDRAALADVLRARHGGKGGRSSRRAPGLLSGTPSEEREATAADLAAILHGVVPRRYGERAATQGGFTTCLAPSPLYERMCRLKRPLP